MKSFISIGLIGLVCGCGGLARKGDESGSGAGAPPSDTSSGGLSSSGGASSGGASSGGASSGGASSGGASTMVATKTTETIDAASGASDPSIPQDSGAFVWHFGLGNWFVNATDGTHHDGLLETVDGVTARHAVGNGQGASLDLWAQLDHPTGKPRDLSAYSGISFDVRASNANELLVAFNVNGQLATLNLASQPSVPISDAWQSSTLRFADVGLDPTAVTSIDFIVRQPAQPFDLWVRNLDLVCDDACP
jgi:hypothetical protein